MTFSSIRRIVRKVLLSIAYLVCVLQWLWVMTIALPPLIEGGAFDGLISSSRPVEPATQPQPMEMSPVMWGLVILVTTAMITVTIAVLIRLPTAVAKTGDRAVQKAADSVIPIIVRHQPIPVKKRKALSRRIRLLIQLTATGLPLGISLFLPSFEDITKQIVITIATYLAATSVLLFVAAWLLEDTTSRTRSHAFHG
jgi:hypothetical protein